MSEILGGTEVAGASEHRTQRRSYAMSESAKRAKWAVLALLGTVGVALAQAPQIAMPDPQLTPGAIASTDVGEVCSRSYARSHRATTLEMKEQVARFYGLPRSAWHGVEFDHRVPLCAGGSDEIANLWPQPIAQAEAKDAIEWHVCAAVCTGKVPLVLAQTWFMSDWRLLIGKEIGR